MSVTYTRHFWEGYSQGVLGLAKRNLYSGIRSSAYEDGYAEGLSIYDERRSTDSTTKTLSDRARTNQVLAKQNKIEELENEIALLRAEVRALEAQG